MESEITARGRPPYSDVTFRLLKLTSGHSHPGIQHPSPAQGPATITASSQLPAPDVCHRLGLGCPGPSQQPRSRALGKSLHPSESQLTPHGNEAPSDASLISGWTVRGDRLCGGTGAGPGRVPHLAVVSNISLLAQHLPPSIPVVDWILSKEASHTTLTLT